MDFKRTRSHFHPRGPARRAPRQTSIGPKRTSWRSGWRAAPDGGDGGLGRAPVSQGAAARTYNPAHDDCHRLRRSTLDATRAGPGADRHVHDRAQSPGRLRHRPRRTRAGRRRDPAAGRRRRGVRLARCPGPWRDGGGRHPLCHAGAVQPLRPHPPCVDAVLAAARVVVAIGDPNPLVNGQGLARARRRHRRHHRRLPEEALALNAGFISRMSRGLPWVWMKMAASLDGRSALHNGMSQWITGAGARGRPSLARAAASC